MRESTEKQQTEKTEFIAGDRMKAMRLICIISACMAMVSGFVGGDSVPYVICMAILSALFVVGYIFLRIRKEYITEKIATIGVTIWIVYTSIAFGSTLGHQNYLIIALVAISIYYSKGTYRMVVVSSVIALSVFVSLYQRYNQPLFDLPAAVNLLFAVNVVLPLMIIAIICWNVISASLYSQHVIEQQKLALTESNEFKDKVFSIIGHDMRAPFNSAKSLIDLLENDLLTREERNAVLKELREGIDVSLQTLDNILGWASQGYYGSVLKTKTKLEHLDMHELVERVIKFFGHTAASKQISFVNEIPKATFVKADLEQISFVFRNLTSNALKFSFHGQDITYTARQDAEGRVTISIKDKGVGMTREMLSSLFQITTRFSREGTTNEKGTGLGLLFCKEFVENNNGKMWIESMPGKGTTVNFTLQPLYTGA